MVGSFDWNLEYWSKVCMENINAGLMLTLIFGVIILLRPVTNRLLRPGQRLPLWYLGWELAWVGLIYGLLGRVRVLPVTFRSLMSPKTTEHGIALFLPETIGELGDCAVSLPGGGQVPVHLSQGIVIALAAVYVAGVAAGIVWQFRRVRILRGLTQQGEKMDREQVARYGLDPDNTTVRLCRNLPTSFVRTGLYDEYERYIICIQRELSEEQMRLVLLHEGEHIRKHHLWITLAVMMPMVVNWWNPVLWLACRLTCRDMELACDEAVMAKLDDRDRREYARTLVDLGSGRHMWAANSFGECDAALRVKNAANWRPQKGLAKSLSWALALLMVLFFFCGAPAEAKPVHLESERDWDTYLYSDQPVQEMRRILRSPNWTPKEIWMRQPEELWFLSEDGEWYHVWFRWDEARGYSFSSAVTGWDPFEDCVQVK